MPKRPVLLLFLLLVVLAFFAVMLSPSLTGSIVARPVPAEAGAFRAYFCQVDDCEQAMLAAIGNASEVACAFYDLDDKPLERLLDEKEAQVLVFAENYAGFGKKVAAAHGGLMHDKFCVLDAGTDHAIVITGSANPTVNGFTKNDNNLVIVEGDVLAQNYLDEWDELAGKRRERKVRYPLINHTIILNSSSDSSFLLENYFCPEDGCEEHVLEELDKARVSIDFMTFSFTSDPIGNELVDKDEKGILVRGVFERRQESKYSEHSFLKDAGLAVALDGNPATMHHKVFIVDADDPENAAVILGSYNPTKSGNERNDENVLIVHDRAIAQRFEEEFARVYGAAGPSRP